MHISLWSYFTDPVLQASTIGSILMCLSSALIGVIVFLRRRSLLAETLSHASYPGVVISVFITAHFFPKKYDMLSGIILVGAFCSCVLALWLVGKMERSLKVKNDAALCFVLSIFFGLGVLLASRLQFSHGLWYKTVQVFLFGQAATMTNAHVLLYSLLAVLSASVLFFIYRPLQIALFDREYAQTVGVPIALIDSVIFFLLILAIIIGIRSVGVVLMAGMLIAPVIAARQFSDRLSRVFILSAFLGAVSGFLGNYCSIEIPQWGKRQGWDWTFTLPTGPVILLIAASFCLFAFLFAPRKGFVQRVLRAVHFRRECQRENVLKYLCKKKDPATFDEIKKDMNTSSWNLFWLLFHLQRQGWIKKEHTVFYLKSDGHQRALQIIRLHRLWEVYLVHLGQGVEKVHHLAEEMEHILTPEIERELTVLLDNPRMDPHKQPIPLPSSDYLQGDLCDSRS